MTECNPAATPGTTSLKATSEHETDLRNDERKTSRRMVGKLQCLTYTRPDICYATKELARSLNKPTTHEVETLASILARYKAPQVYRASNSTENGSTQRDQHHHTCRCRLGRMPNNTTQRNRLLHLHARNMRTHGSRTQATVALSSVESERYAIGTGATESLHLVHFLNETFGNNVKITLQICTDSSAGKSLARRIGSSKKAKHIEPKYLFIQQLVRSNFLQICKTRTDENGADILTKHVSLETLLRDLYAVGLIDQQPQH